jgi:hypothetical protein
MRGVRLLLAYLLAVPFATAGLLCIVFIGTAWLGVLLLIWAGLLGAWGWWPFIASGAQLLQAQQEKYIGHMEAQEEDIPVQDIVPIPPNDREGS